jgi:hypothetical protein
MISCRPTIYLESLSVFFEAVYIPPKTDAETKFTLNELYTANRKTLIQRRLS